MTTKNKIKICLISGIAPMILSTIPVMCADTTTSLSSHSVMQFNGEVEEIEDSYTSETVANIEKTDGKEASEAYIEAMKIGDYSKFYEITGCTDATSDVADYMTFNGEEYTGNVLTTAQSIEQDIQTVYGPTGTIDMVRKAADEAGYEITVDGINDYIMDILLGDAKRPADATDPVYRLSETGAEFRTDNDAAKYWDKGIITEYPDNPLTDEQKSIAGKMGKTIKEATDEEIENAKTSSMGDSQGIGKGNDNASTEETTTDTTSVSGNSIGQSANQKAENNNTLIFIIGGAALSCIILGFAGYKIKYKK